MATLIQPVADTREPWIERLHHLRDRLVASPRFQRFAAAFPLTRPIANRRAQALFDLCAGFVYSQVLFACVRLDLFRILHDQPARADSLAGRMLVQVDRLERLLEAAAALGLLRRRRDGRYGLGPHGAAMIGNPAIEAMVEHHGLLYADLGDPLALLRGEAGPGRLAAYWPYAGAGSPAAVEDEATRAYSRLMDASQAMLADDVLDAYPLERHRCLLDVGGGEGAFVKAAGRRQSNLRLMLFDLPPVAERARAGFAPAGLAERATATGGDFAQDPLPQGADVISLVRVVHDHEDEVVLTLLGAVNRALPDGGTLLLAEPMAGTPGAEAVGAYFTFYLMAMGSGRPRTPQELRELLQAAGFEEVRMHRTRRPFLTRVLTAKPARQRRAAVSVSLT